jgi:hypothetical protein
LRFLFVLARRDRAWVQLPAQPRVLNISALFCISFTTLLLLLLPVLCLLCVQSPGAITPGAAIVTNVDDVVWGRRPDKEKEEKKEEKEETI